MIKPLNNIPYPLNLILRKDPVNTQIIKVDKWFIIKGADIHDTILGQVVYDIVDKTNLRGVELMGLDMKQMLLWQRFGRGQSVKTTNFVIPATIIFIEPSGIFYHPR